MKKDFLSQYIDNMRKFDLQTYTTKLEKKKFNKGEKGLHYSLRHFAF